MAQRNWRHPRLLPRLLATLLLVGLPLPVAGQAVVQGVAVGGNTGLPLPGALVVSTGPSNQRRSQLTSSDGSYRLEFPVSGRWSIRATHLGFRDWTAEVEVDEGEMLELDIVFDVDPVALEGLMVSVEARCPRPADPQGTVALLQEVRQAFLSRELPPVVLRYSRRVQELSVHNALRGNDPWSEPLWIEEVAMDTVALRTTAPIEDLALAGNGSAGFIGPSFEGGERVFAYDFLLPSAQVLLSPAFQETHCFDAVDRTGWKGLAFSAAPRSSIEYDIAGTLWLPLQPDSFPRIDFEYTRFPPGPSGEALESTIDPARHLRDVRRGKPLYPIPRERLRPDARFGGRVEMSPVAGVGWVPHQVELRIPVVSQVEAVLRNRCCATVGVWLVTSVRRTTYRLLSLDPDGEAR